MTVIPGCGPLLAKETTFAVVVCNGCGFECKTVRADGRDYYAWFRKGSTPPGWTSGQDERFGVFWHRCAACSKGAQ